MKILFLSNHLDTGGITSYLFTLSTALRRQGHVIYIASSGGNTEEQFLKEGISLIKVPLRTKSEASPKVIISLFKLFSRIKKEEIDIIHANTRVTQALAFWLYKLCGVPYVSTCHGFFRPSLHRKLFPLWGEKVISISESVAEHLRHDFNINPRKIALVYNGIDVENFKSRSRESGVISQAKNKFGLKDAFVIGIIARLSSVKGHKYLIRAFSMLLKEKPDAQLFIVGDGSLLAELTALAEDLNIKENVLFVPSVKNTSQALSAMDVFVMPSLQEGLGIALMEAMASGLAVVASDIGGLRNLVKDNENGILVQPKDVEGIFKALLLLLNDDNKRHQFGTKAREFILNNFSQDKMSQETLCIYEEAKAHINF